MPETTRTRAAAAAAAVAQGGGAPEATVNQKLQLLLPALPEHLNDEPLVTDHGHHDELLQVEYLVDLQEARSDRHNNNRRINKFSRHNKVHGSDKSDRWIECKMEARGRSHRQQAHVLLQRSRETLEEAGFERLDERLEVAGERPGEDAALREPHGPLREHVERDLLRH